MGKTAAPVAKVEPVRPAITTAPGQFVGAVSLKSMAKSMNVARPVHVLDAPTSLSNEQLHKFWDELIVKTRANEETKAISDLLIDKVVYMEGDDKIVIDVNNSYFESKLKPFQMRILEWLRKKSGVQSLSYRVNVKEVEHKKSLYSPADRYDALLEKNPTLSKLRSLFPDLEY